MTWLGVLLTPPACLVGEFTPDNQQRIKHEEDKEHTKLDKWKARISAHRHLSTATVVTYTN